MLMLGAKYVSPALPLLENALASVDIISAIFRTNVLTPIEKKRREKMISNKAVKRKQRHYMLNVAPRPIT